MVCIDMSIEDDVHLDVSPMQSLKLLKWICSALAQDDALSKRTYIEESYVAQQASQSPGPCYDEDSSTLVLSGN